MSKTKLYIIAGAVVLIVALMVFFYFRGKKKGESGITIQYDPGQLPGNPQSGSTQGASNDDIKLLATQLFQDMDGFNFLGHDMTPYQKALTYNDSDLVKLYNAFNAKYQQDSGQTLAQWLDNESFYNNEVTDALLQRFSKLNLI